MQITVTVGDDAYAALAARGAREGRGIAEVAASILEDATEPVTEKSADNEKKASPGHARRTPQERRADAEQWLARVAELGRQMEEGSTGSGSVLETLQEDRNRLERWWTSS
jgi:DUF438 domain-containing protein